MFAKQRLVFDNESKKSKSSLERYNVSSRFFFIFLNFSPDGVGSFSFWFSLLFKSGPRLTLREIRSDVRSSRGGKTKINIFHRVSSVCHVVDTTTALSPREHCRAGV